MAETLFARLEKVEIIDLLQGHSTTKILNFVHSQKRVIMTFKLTEEHLMIQKAQEILLIIDVRKALLNATVT